MKITAKSCPNCGANLKFDLKDTETECHYCHSIIKISNNKVNKDLKDIIYVNKSWEVFKWIMALLHLPLTILIAYFLISRSNPIFSIMLVIGGILSIPVIANLVFRYNRILKVVVIELLIVIGLFGSITTIYPIHINGKLYSKESSMIIEFKGNDIIIEENGVKTKEKYRIDKKVYANGVTYYTIVTKKYTFSYSHHDNDRNNLNDRLYLMDNYDEVAKFYTKKQEEVFGDKLYQY